MSTRRNAAIILTHTTAYPFRLPDSEMQCVYCCTSFENPLDFRAHMRTDHRSYNMDTAFAHCKYECYVKADCTELQCKLCSEMFDELEKIAIHLYEFHDKKINMNFELGILPFRLENDKMDCYYCSKNFSGIRQLSRHLASHYMKFTCELCGKSYISKTSLRQHMLFGHRGDAHICRKCKERFDSAEAYKQHMNESTACWMHVCNICGDRFRGWHLKESHLMDVHGRPSKTFRCRECDKVCESRKALRIHFKFSHTDEALICSYCGQKFDSKRFLDDHLPVHTQEKHFTCSVCAKPFARKKNLEQHMWIHREEKRFQCVTCNKKFNQRVSWRTHMKSHHPEYGVV